ncbi:alpha/beta hydrolase [Phenylobacterium sp. 20VBR1]|uniref:Alpha/beta hydrolase n=1 Tax=Phenylobacterium glaciei TaxID=2803784 RepID=A0A941HWF1_9CAUL|nr:alpha/beta hydrolase [Phenylobacterium glaciei]MBR7619470.1 alpha/beta hydrolase [Phenylobacterium glaciei]
MNRRSILALGATATVLPLQAQAAKPRPHRAVQVVARDGTRLFHRDWGDGAPMVFMAGWTLTSEAWAYQAADLSDQGVRCIAYDRRGHGRSADPGRGYDIDTLADDLDSVLTALDLTGVTIVAHSMASGEITRYLTRHGQGRIARVVYLAPTTPFLTRTADNPQGAPAAYFEQARKTWKTDFPRWLDDNTDPFVTSQTSAGMKDWIKSIMLTCSMQALVECNKAMVGTDFRQELTRLAVPCLVIQGDKDMSAPLALTGRRTAELIPGAKLVVYEGAPHGLFITHMDRLNADLLAYARS